MKLQEVMTSPVIQIDPEESVAVAARMLTHYNIGALPVCDGKGKLYGMVTDRDLVTRCLASGRSPAEMKVRDVMTKNVVSAARDTDTQDAARLMGQRQIRRLPVVDRGRICGMVSLGDLANSSESQETAAGALARISSNISFR